MALKFKPPLGGKKARGKPVPWREMIKLPPIEDPEPPPRETVERSERFIAREDGSIVRAVAKRQRGRGIALTLDVKQISLPTEDDD